MNLSGFIFPSEVNFSGLDIDARVDFKRAVFHGEANFSNVKFRSEADFEDAVFQQRAKFTEAKFGDQTTFKNTRFFSDVVFDEAKFRRDVIFYKTKFSEIKSECSKKEWVTSFAEAEFHGDANFQRARFFNRTSFIDTRFHESSLFNDVKFDDRLRFFQTKFGGFASFNAANFKNEADFSASQCEKGFELTRATFKILPDFNQAHFTEGPQLDRRPLQKIRLSAIRLLFDILVIFLFSFFSMLTIGSFLDFWGYAAFWTTILVGYCGSLRIVESARRQNRHDVAAKYRALKRLANQSQDHASEAYYFRQELRLMRGDYVVWHPYKWMSVCYELFSNFGSSIFLPIMWWCIAWCLFSVYYFEHHVEYVSQKNHVIQLHQQKTPCYLHKLYHTANYMTGYALLAGGVFIEKAAFHLRSSVIPGLEIQVIRRSKSFQEDARKLQNASHLSDAALKCLSGKGAAMSGALGLSFSNGTGGFLGAGHDEKLKQTYACLFGINRDFKKLHEQELIPTIPDAVAVAGVLQAIFSLILLFLLLLALRNYFRIRS